MVWKRPEAIPYPKVWHKFQAKGLREDGQLEWYIVQDLPEERFEDAMRHLSKHFARDEQMNQAKGLDQDSTAMEEVVRLWKVMLPERLSLVCFREGSDEIVGVNVLGVASKSDEDELKFKSDIFQTIFDTIGYISQQANVFEHYGVDHYLNAMGLSVDPVYRGRGIATELLRARSPLCKEIGLKLTSTCFTGIGSQTAARKAGFEENYSITYGELAKVDDRFVFPGLEEKSCKYMSLKIE
ncbi:arylalkylamine N-acetyltransferase-like 2 [Armigeres subalbatus]|uniref:arylalkylamine N-acetyltransferase-like 2 n=1 Tax=Armigeres subalbatus TaxID=124917 RepID=UPI002ED49C43